jgi:predicted hydrolase (HD superfamily)
MSNNKRLQRLHQLGLMEGKADPKEHPFFGAHVLRAIDAKKPTLERIHRRYSKINAARRRYVLGDDSAFEET